MKRLYIHIAESYDVNKDKFPYLLCQGMDLNNLTIKEAAQAFTTAPGTITRWRKGISAPPQTARRLIIQDLAERLK